MLEVPTFLELRMLENTMKVESFEVPKSSELRKKILELRSLNLELRNFEVPTPYARHCFTPDLRKPRRGCFPEPIVVQEVELDSLVFFGRRI